MVETRKTVTVPDSDTQVKKRGPAKGIRKLFNPDGDVRVYQMITPDHESGMPVGALVPVPEAPQFLSAAEARRWVKYESGDRLAGMHVLVVQALEEMDIQVATKPTVVITSRPKLDVPTKPKKK